LNQSRNWFSAAKLSGVHIDQCVKSQEKPTEIISQVSAFRAQKCLPEIRQLSIFQKFLTKFHKIRPLLPNYTALFLKFCLNRLIFSYFIIKCVHRVAVFFPETLYVAFPTLLLLHIIRYDTIRYVYI